MPGDLASSLARPTRPALVTRAWPLMLALAAAACGTPAVSPDDDARAPAADSATVAPSDAAADHARVVPADTSAPRVDSGPVELPSECTGIPGCRRTPASECAPSSAVELGSAATAAAPRALGVDTYAVADVLASSDSHRVPGDDVSAVPWVDGDDARVRFRAPRGGRWRLTARGARLHVLVARRECRGDDATLAGFARNFDEAATFWQYTGPHAVNELAVEVQAQRDERFELVLDGCPRGGACRYAVRAERIDALACPAQDSYSVPRTSIVDPCGAAAQCFVDPRDPERFACVTHAALDAVAPREATAWLDDRGSIVIAGTVANWPAGITRQTRSYRVELLDERGAVILSAPTRYVFAIENGAFGPQIIHEYTPAAARALRLQLAAAFPGTLVAPAPLVVAIRPGPPYRGDGEACTPLGWDAPCRDGLACVATDGGARHTCRPPPAAARVLSDVRAWRQPGRDLVLVTARSVRLDRWSLYTPELRVELLDWTGAVLSTHRAYASYTEYDDPLTVGAFVVTAPAGGARVERARVVVDPATRAPAQFDIPVRDPIVRAVGEPCGGPYIRDGYASGVSVTATCGAGLTCGGASGRRCGLALPDRGCNGAAVPDWAPPAGGTHAITGPTTSAGYSRTCSAGGRAYTFAATFATPYNGTWIYRFESEGLRSLRVEVLCGTSDCPVETSTGGAPIELTLQPLQRARVVGVTDDAQREFTVRVTVPDAGP